MTVAELIEILRALPASASVIVQGYESGFNDAICAARWSVTLAVTWGAGCV
ncbi:hypothetical protein [Paraburkholderia sp. GAS334]|uniref:hypothetical protein n=1 Tax=Paraburkholderia sp. GAS334 TaxID=3035131 RepID=UPI003D1A04AB